MIAIKKLIIILSLMLLTLLSVAAPARRNLRTITQPDGSQLTIQQHGDEYHHWTATTDGALVIQTQEGCFIAQIGEQGQLLATNVLAHEPAQRKILENELIVQQQERKALFAERGQQASRRAISISSNKFYLPHSGSPRVLVILAEYQDVKFTVNNPVQAFEQFLNGDSQQDLGNHNTNNIASVRQYFEACSKGKFSPRFDVVGPVTLPYNMSYYGGSSAEGSDERFSVFCNHSIQKVRDAGLVKNWSIYDNNADNYVELVCIIFAGYGQNQGGANETMWAKASAENIDIDNFRRAYFFNCCCELNDPDPSRADWINGIGPFIHEFSHCMGLPDIYATESSGYVNNQSMESWDVMDYGLYCGPYEYDGSAPAPYLAWEQLAMGWSAMEVLEHSQQGLTLYPMADVENGKAYKIPNADNENEFIVLENIQLQGLNLHAYGHGLLVYHVAYPYTRVDMMDHPNNKAGRPAVATVPAGGLQISRYLRGDGQPYSRKEWLNSIAAAPFPGTQNISALNSDMVLPNYLFYVEDSGSKAVGYSLNSIKEDTSTGCITLNVIDESDPSGFRELSTSTNEKQQSWYTLSGQRVSNPTRGLYIVNGKKVVR